MDRGGLVVGFKLMKYHFCDIKQISDQSRSKDIVMVGDLVRPWEFTGHDYWAGFMTEKMGVIVAMLSTPEDGWRCTVLMTRQSENRA
jgi:hypothetical protein